MTSELTLSAEEWRSFFAPYTDIVLVANNDEVDAEELASTFPETTLFIFFNKVYKVLRAPFRRPAVLACRSGTMGANVVHRREVADVLGYFDPASFLGVVNVAIMATERFSPAEAFGGVPVRHLHLGQMILGYYPKDKFPTTGFGLCMWLQSLDLPAQVHLAGFSSKRSERWKVFDVHDWTFEQVLLRLLSREGRFRIIGSAPENPYLSIATHFPQFSATDIALTADEVLSERMLGLSSIVDRLMSVTKVLRFFDNSFRRIRPKTRKQKFLSKSQTDAPPPSP